MLARLRNSTMVSGILRPRSSGKSLKSAASVWRKHRKVRLLLTNAAIVPISYRQLEEMMEERGVGVDHSTLNRWVLKYVPLLDQAFRVRKRRVGGNWRMDETYVRIRSQ
jgi:transposase-like protein